MSWAAPRLAVALLAAAATVLAGPAATAGAAYVALGDSFTAGPLIPNQVGLPLGCLRSDRNYPALVQRDRAYPLLRDVSCSGATTDDLSAAQAVVGGSNAPQLDAVDRRAELVTLGIGGNDIGLVAAAITCLSRGLLEPTGTACRRSFARPGGRDALVTAIAATAPKVAAALDAIRTRAPAARMLLVGYPAVAPQDGRACYPFVPLSSDDLRYFDELLVQTNAMLAEQAAAHDAEFVDAYRDSIGHDVCTAPGTRWFEGLVPTMPAAPVHPNALGEAALARSVLGVLARPRPAAALTGLRRSRRVLPAGRPAQLAYTLSRAADVVVTVRKAVVGRRTATGCGRATAATRRAAACRRYQRILARTVAGERGVNALQIGPRTFGRRGGLYRLTATVRPLAGERPSAAQHVQVRVARRR